MGPAGAREHLRQTALQAFVPVPLAAPWASMSVWEAGAEPRPRAHPSTEAAGGDERRPALPGGFDPVGPELGQELLRRPRRSTGGPSWPPAAVERGELRPSEARILLIGRSSEDARDSMILGPSGIVATSPPWFPATHEPGRRRVTWANGLVEAIAFSAAEPDGPRGQNAIGCWADEACSWGPRLADTWSNIDLATRIGPAPRILATSTPRALPWLKELLARPDTLDIVGATSENTALAPDVVQGFFSRYGGAIAAQELRGEIVDITAASWFPAADTRISTRPRRPRAAIRAWDLAATARPMRRPIPTGPPVSHGQAQERAVRHLARRFPAIGPWRRRGPDPKDANSTARRFGSSSPRIRAQPENPPPAHWWRGWWLERG